jgi:hypothetical protein
MSEEITTQVGRSEAPRIIAAANHQTFFLIDLYAGAVGGLFDELQSSFQLVGFAMGLTTFNIVSLPLLVERLEMQHNTLSGMLAMIELIESEYLGAPVLPKRLREFVAIEQDLIRSSQKRSNGSALTCSAGLRQPADCAAEARAEVEGMIRDGIPLGTYVGCYMASVNIPVGEWVLLKRFDERVFTNNYDTH